jgi:hypothetical protein
MAATPVEQDIPVEVKRALLEQEIGLWRNTKYITSVRYRVQKGIGTPAEELAPLVRDLEKCEKMLDALNGELAALPAQP